MGKYTEACGTTATSQNIATGGINESPTLGRTNEAFWSSNGFSFPSVAAAKLKSNWDAAVKAGDLIYLGEVEATSNGAERSVFENKNLGIKFTTEVATSVLNFISQNCPCTHAELSKMSGRGGRIFRRTELNNLIGRYNDDGTVVGQPIGELYVGYKQLESGDNPGYTPMEVTFNDPKGDNENPFDAQINFSFSEIDQVYRANLAIDTVVIGASATFNATITGDCDGSAVTGAVLADFKALDANGGDLTITSVTPTANVYAFDVATTQSGFTIEIDEIKEIASKLWISDREEIS